MHGMPERVPENEEGAVEFEFDLATPLFEQIRVAFESVEPVPLDEEHLARIENRPGLYGLYLDDQIVYVGKADESVGTRLRKHRRTIAGRRNISTSRVKFKCVYLAITWDPFKPESALMEHYGTTREWGWNSKGFGSNDPGRRRDHTVLRENHWHRRYPLNPDWPCESVEAGTYNALDLLQRIAADVPFWFRFQGNQVSGSGRQREEAEEARWAYERTTVEVPRTGMTARELLYIVASNLGEAWQATITPSHMLLYKERGEMYPLAEVICPA